MSPGLREPQRLTAAPVAIDGFPYSSCRRESCIVRFRGDDYEPTVGRSPRKPFLITTTKHKRKRKQHRSGKTVSLG